MKKIKKVKCTSKIDGIHYIIWEYLVENKKVEFIHHDDVGNYFSIENKDNEAALNLIKEKIQAI